ncbi:hypothetical protein OESDEN_20612 [Oesophagostomum dentatum]|uniref:Uncharacterized protein n=1 Tax=Oesophagostomum dentatum TaxID=61180 RepID=A0A0B1S319_OESDE|nr:hypothetical protein OESDEN_20612 [Oesophagostomum dentatum]
MWINMAITWSPNMPPIALFAWLTQEWRLLAMLNAFVCVPGILFCLGKAGEEVENVVLNEYELARRTGTKKRKYSVHHLFYSRKLAVTTTVLAFS